MIRELAEVALALKLVCKYIISRLYSATSAIYSFTSAHCKARHQMLQTPMLIEWHRSFSAEELLLTLTPHLFNTIDKAVYIFISDKD